MPLQVHGKALPSLLMTYRRLVDIFKTFQRLFNVQVNSQMRLIGCGGGLQFLWSFVILVWFEFSGRRWSIAWYFNFTNFTAISSASVKHRKVLTIFTSEVVFFVSYSLQFQDISAFSFYFVWLLLFQSLKWVEEMDPMQSCLCNSFCYST